MSLATPPETAEKLQKSLHAKAKAEPNFRFYSLWDKVCRDDVLRHAYRVCRANDGAPGVDGESFQQIEAHGLEDWLGNLQKEHRDKQYAPAPLLRVWIPKSTGGQRPLSIPPIRDRVAQTALLTILEPIFESDLPDEQFGFRRGRDAKRAVRVVRFHLTKRGRTDIVDADLRDYFNTIPHGSLLKCVARRVSDGNVLTAIKTWLCIAVVERTRQGQQRTTEARDRRHGVPQGSPISPLLSNLYSRRFVLAWRKFGYERRLNAHIVNYADDLVICCRPGAGAEAMVKMRETMGRLGLTLNEQKTRLVVMPEGSFDFLSYTFCRQFRHDKRPYLGIRPSQKALSRILRRIREATTPRWCPCSAKSRVEDINEAVLGWCGYFDQGTVAPTYRTLTRHLLWRIRRWLSKKHKRRGTGARQYPLEFLTQELGLYLPQVPNRDRLRAKA